MRTKIGNPAAAVAGDMSVLMMGLAQMAVAPLERQLAQPSGPRGYSAAQVAEVINTANARIGRLNKRAHDAETSVKALASLVNEQQAFINELQNRNSDLEREVRELRSLPARWTPAPLVAANGPSKGLKP